MRRKRWRRRSLRIESIQLCKIKITDYTQAVCSGDESAVSMIGRVGVMISSELTQLPPRKAHGHVQCGVILHCF